MPHASEDGVAAAGEDACSSDELIVFKDEDGGEDVVKRSSDKVTEEKSDLIDLSESEVKKQQHFYYINNRDRRVVFVYRRRRWRVLTTMGSCVKSSCYRCYRFSFFVFYYRIGILIFVVMVMMGGVNWRKVAFLVRRARTSDGLLLLSLFIFCSRRVQLLLSDEGLFNVEQVKTGVCVYVCVCK